MPNNTAFMFEVKVDVATDEGTLTIEHKNWESKQLEIHFDSEFTSDPTPSQTTIDFFNLSQTTINRFKKGQKVTLSAGFEGDVGVVTSGTIKYIHPPVYSNGDYMFEIIVYEGEDFTKDKREFTDTTDTTAKYNQIQVTFTAGVSARYVLETLSRRANIPVNIVSLKNNKNYDEAYSASGRPIDCMQEVTEYAESKLFYRHGILTAQDINDDSYNANFDLRTETGLIESPQKEEDDDWEGYSIKSIFNHRFATASVIKVTDTYVKGTFRALSGSHTFDGISPETALEVQ